MFEIKAVIHYEASQVPIVYAEGWQSWSPTNWWSAGNPQPRPATETEFQMRWRPDSPLHGDETQAEGLMVLNAGHGLPVHRFAVMNPDGVVPTIRCKQDGLRVIITANGPIEHTEHPDAESALSDWAVCITRARKHRNPPRVWCSWYQYFEEVTTCDIFQNIKAIQRLKLPVDVIQIDDGWNLGVGNYFTHNPRFGDVEQSVSQILDSGFQAGVWLAPFVVGAETPLAAEHPDWLTAEAGYNWNQQIRGIDLANDAVLDLITSQISYLANIGVTYFKLDFLYAGALGREAALPAYRHGLAAIRKAAGQMAFIVGCGAPLIPSIGLVDAMRIASDTFHEGGEGGSEGLRGASSVLARRWQHHKLWNIDPDCMVMRPSYSLRGEWGRILNTVKGMRSISDNLNAMDDHGMKQIRRYLT